MLLLKKYTRSIVIATILSAVGIVGIQAEEAKQQIPPQTWDAVTPAMQKSMDPNVWSQFMAMMMNPQKSSAVATCALCHQGDDIARYQKDFGMLMDSMWEPYKAVMNPHMMLSFTNPNAYMGMMNPAMYMNMMYPMMGMMGPMMGMGAPMMNPAMYMNMMYPMMGMMGPAMGGMYGGNPMAQVPGAQMMDPKQYEQWFGQWNEMMKNFMPQAQQ